MERTTESYLLKDILQCGYMDIDFLIQVIDSNDLDTGDIWEEAKSMSDNPNINDVLSAAVRLAINGIRDKYDIELEEDEHYTTFFNCIDTHCNAKEEEIRELRDQKRSEIEEEKLEEFDLETEEIIKAINSIL